MTLYNLFIVHLHEVKARVSAVTSYLIIQEMGFFLLEFKLELGLLLLGR